MGGLYPRMVPELSEKKALRNNFQDRVVQEVIQMILKAIYEPMFMSNSHGCGGCGFLIGVNTALNST
jgi:hypothetical protein